MRSESYLELKKPGQFHWDPDEKKIDEAAFENLDAIIHLAGAPISKRWTKSYKKEVYDSRVESADLLFEFAKKLNSPVKKFITASGTNYYGTQTTDKIFTENDKHANDFLGKLCFDLENSAQKFEEIGASVSMVRTAAVLSKKGGMLKELMPIAKWNLLSALGSGKQILPWIHIDDLTDIYIQILENENLNGAYNASAPEFITQKEFVQKLTKAMDKKVIFPNVPSFMLKLILGEMSTILLKGSAISSEKIQKTGFDFKFKNSDAALKDLIT
ncbi:TIGR01777 family oxidoreductase [Moheibacter lacus]|uniref:TIGR01777 family protein n=1 Tax=Moheibacter lacus TaxID=2745851 RepID=A0A838ZRQ3_9FLAO|nr:TIGR01777 family oxidoreductase [Moheibacter lacus]MBA5629442.1 TIGR01777 family protein [Moheibacter lacus]